jgi:hypothetical protein
MRHDASAFAAAHNSFRAIRAILSGLLNSSEVHPQILLEHNCSDFDEQEAIVL